MPISMLQSVNIAFAKAPGNLQLYFNFENNTTNGGTLGGDLSFNDTTNFTYDNTTAKLGSYSLKVTTASANTGKFVGYPNFTLPATNGFSVSCWFRFPSDSANSSYYPVLFYHPGTGLAYTRFGFFFAPNAGQFGNMLLVCGNSSPSVANQLTITRNTYTAAPYNVSLAGGWNHIGWSINSSGFWTVLLNGQYVSYSTQTLNLSTISTTNTFYLAQEGPTFPKLNCNLDAFRLYNTSLSQEQLLSLYTQGI